MGISRNYDSRRWWYFDVLYGGEGEKNSIRYFSIDTEIFVCERLFSLVVSNVVSAGKAALGGPWVLVDHFGKPVTDASYRGKYTLLYFGFTYCPDICPNELVKVGKIMDELSE